RNQASDLGLFGTLQRPLTFDDTVRQHAQSRFRVPCCTGGFYEAAPPPGEPLCPCPVFIAIRLSVRQTKCLTKNIVGAAYKNIRWRKPNSRGRLEVPSTPRPARQAAHQFLGMGRKELDQGIARAADARHLAARCMGEKID